MTVTANKWPQVMLFGAENEKNMGMQGLKGLSSSLYPDHHICWSINATFSAITLAYLGKSSANLKQQRV